MYCVIDCETAPQSDLIYYFNSKIKAPSNYKSEEAINKYLEEAKIASNKKMSVDVDYCDIIIIGFKEEGKTSEILSDKKEIENKLNEIVGYTVITFNGLHFDIPAIIRYGIKNNLNLPYGWLNTLTSKYEKKHIDLSDRLLQYGDYKSLDTLSKIYLGKEKKEINFETCSLDELINHNREDLLLTEQLYLKFKPLFI